MLDCSTRQVRRLVGGFARTGAAALVHGNRGRTPGQPDRPMSVRAQVLDLARGEFAGFNPVHLAELMARTAARAGHLGAVGAPDPRGGGHPASPDAPAARPRSRRERMPRAGMLLQVDGSKHDWLEGRGPWLNLVSGIDDATG